MLTSAPATEALTFRLVVDLDVACGVDLTLDCPLRKNVAVDVQLADQGSRGPSVTELVRWAWGLAFLAGG